MFTSIHPKLPMRDKAATKQFFIDQLGFAQFGGEYPDYLMVEKDGIQIHFFLFRELDPKENYGQVYIRTDRIEEVYEYINGRGVKTTPLTTRPWGQKEFALLDPDNNLLTIGQSPS